MSTNYYAKISKCDKCGQSTTIKIAEKSSGPMNIYFEFIRPKEIEYPGTLLEYIKVLVNSDARIYDEYDKEIELIHFLKWILSDPNTCVKYL